MGWSVRAEERGLAYYIETSTEVLLIAVRNKEGLNNVSEAPKAFREWKKIERLNEWRGKVLQGQILRQTENVGDKSSWDWLQIILVEAETDKKEVLPL